MGRSKQLCEADGARDQFQASVVFVYGSSEVTMTISRFVLTMTVSLLVSCYGTVTYGANSQYIRYDAETSSVIVFVHGIFGDGNSTWTGKNNSYWPEMLTRDASFGHYNIYVYEYPTGYSGEELSIDEISENMRLLFDTDKVSAHSKIVFIAHSMGGLVVRSYLLKNPNSASHTPMIYFFSTPTTGSELASIALLVANNPQLAQIKPMRSAEFLANLQRQWLDADLNIASFCAYETKKTFGINVVTQGSASNLCNKRLDPIPEDHFTIVKPSSYRDPAYLAFKSALEEIQKRGSRAREQLLKLFEAAKKGDTGSVGRETVAEVAARFGLTTDEIENVLRIMPHVPSVQLTEKVAEVGNKYRELLAQLTALSSQKPSVCGSQHSSVHRLIEQAEAEIKVGSADSLNKAHQFLSQVTQANKTAAQLTLSCHQEQQIQAAASSAAEGDLSMIQLDYERAAKLFREAGALVPQDSAYTDKRIAYLKREADALYRHGYEYGPALNLAIDRYRRLLELQPRDRVPFDWAQTQNNLGVALRTRGVRGDGTEFTEFLAEAVTAHRKAIEVYSGESTRHQRAQTQNYLGIALVKLGERKRSQALLRDAVTAHREAIDIYSREGMQLQWAQSQNNLGAALRTLGVLEKATDAHRKALGALSRENTPLDWADAQNGLGTALLARGHRDDDTTLLNEAVTVLGNAIRELPRQEVPLRWAGTQLNFGKALLELGRRKSGTSHLERAVAAFRCVIEYTREPMPHYSKLAEKEFEIARAVLDQRLMANHDHGRSSEKVSQEIRCEEQMIN
jgi:tetratricopeptide (TPR) repeat protein